MKHIFIALLLTSCFAAGMLSCSKNNVKQPVYQDTPYLQEISVKFYADTTTQKLLGTAYDRNGKIQVLSTSGLLHTYDGQFLYPGSLNPDKTYRFTSDKNLKAITSLDAQLVYLTDSVVYSNAWAGRVFIKHQLPKAHIFAGGKDFRFLVSDGQGLELVADQKSLWSQTVPAGTVQQISYQSETNTFWVLTDEALFSLSADLQFNKVIEGKGYTAMALTDGGKQMAIGTTNGYLVCDIASKKQVGELNQKLPVPAITAMASINGKLWFGSAEGAFSLREDGKFDYYNGERWLPGSNVLQITEGPAQSILVLTTGGVGQIIFKEMTLADKAAFYDQQVRQRHIRVGFNSTLAHMEKGDLSTGYLSDSDNDGLWTSMYLGGEIFRYAVTKDSAALQNCRESLDAMERLYDINPVAGFPSRSFERSGHIDILHDPERWQHASDKEWDWKSTTSSDEVIGHVFAFGAMAELFDDAELKGRAITLIDTLMSHIVQNDLYLIDFDGKPTMWGKWNPEYVNGFPTNVGDRKLNSSNIVAMLQTAYHFTKKEKYKVKAFELMDKHGYFENMMRPMSDIGKAPDDADEHAKNMSDGWNHSDDEMYFIGYWGLYRYAFNDTLKAHYKAQILDHWEAERPEKDGAWNIFTAITGTDSFDLDEAAWYLREYPLDMIEWGVKNSHRKDIELLEPNFRKQSTKEVLPPDERPVRRHNANTFDMDRINGNGNSENSAGDIWLLPYWMGRYLGVISAPVASSK
ncbi:hypothetical protein CLV98_106245 [Dyadobacter jejuensis]|uniref:Two component regulator with propeller domain n=1 Tax=Dyadobacter jejuensis TaxID=1082580 RepID=A0A316AJ57_9BACT|nr:hypothetical protein [Dyadobacter jejuensis]PWJ57773.1 hypothetical protein CLV98_106245 [Dyadobacter jejuensis]